MEGRNRLAQTFSVSRGSPEFGGAEASLPSGSAGLAPPGQALPWTAGLGGQGLRFCEGTTPSPRWGLAQMQATLWVQSQPQTVLYK